MTVEEIEDLAMVPNARMPHRLSREDQVLFQKFRYLHALYRIGGIAKEQAGLEKHRFLIDHQKQVAREVFRQKQALHTVAMWREMERFCSAYRRQRTLESADQLVDAVSGQLKSWDKLGMN